MEQEKLYVCRELGPDCTRMCSHWLPHSELAECGQEARFCGSIGQGSICLPLVKQEEPTLMPKVKPQTKRFTKKYAGRTYVVLTDNQKFVRVWSLLPSSKRITELSAVAVVKGPDAFDLQKGFIVAAHKLHLRMLRALDDIQRRQREEALKVCSQVTAAYRKLEEDWRKQ